MLGKLSIVGRESISQVQSKVRLGGPEKFRGVICTIELVPNHIIGARAGLVENNAPSQPVNKKLLYRFQISPHHT